MEINGFSDYDKFLNFGMEAATLFVHKVYIFRGFRKIILGVITK